VLEKESRVTRHQKGAASQPLERRAQFKPTVITRLFQNRRKALPGLYAVWQIEIDGNSDSIAHGEILRGIVDAAEPRLVVAAVSARRTLQL
jgi:hypothetical protein